MAKRKSLGFKGGKSLVVYVGQSQTGRINESIINSARDTWNNLEVGWLERSKKCVKRISIEKRTKDTKFAGIWYESTSTLKLLDYGDSDHDFYRGVLLHELAHAWYFKESRLSEDQIKEFSEAVNKLEPITDYTSKNRTIWGSVMYANEIHSAITEHLYTKNKANIGSAENLELILKAYNKLHEDVN